MAQQQTQQAAAVPDDGTGTGAEGPRTRGHKTRSARRKGRSSTGDAVRKIVQIVGELLVTAGLILLLFVAW